MTILISLFDVEVINEIQSIVIERISLFSSIQLPPTSQGQQLSATENISVWF